MAVGYVPRLNFCAHSFQREQGMKPHHCLLAVLGVGLIGIAACSPDVSTGAAVVTGKPAKVYSYTYLCELGTPGFDSYCDDFASLGSGAPPSSHARRGSGTTSLGATFGTRLLTHSSRVVTLRVLRPVTRSTTLEIRLTFMTLFSIAQTALGAERQPIPLPEA
jgi:hypothetical protein